MQPWSRMNVSASRSRSRVVMPGRTWSARCARHSPRIFPEARIFSISSGRFSRKASTLAATSDHLAGAQLAAEDGEDGLRHRLDGCVAIDELDARATALVEADDWRGLLLVLAHPLDVGLGGVVGAVVDLGAVRDALLQLALRDIEEKHHANFPPGPLEHLIELHRLGNGARETVEQDASP